MKKMEEKWYDTPVMTSHALIALKEKKTFGRQREEDTAACPYLNG